MASISVGAQRATADPAAARQAGEDALAARRQAERETTAIQAACQAREEAARQLAAAAIAWAERAETAPDAARVERRALTDRLTTVGGVDHAGTICTVIGPAPQEVITLSLFWSPL